MYFDFYIEDLNLIIEYDGFQHFHPVKYWGGEDGLKENKERDLIKNKYCQDNNIKILRIPYTESIETSLIKNGIISQLSHT